MSKLVVCTNQTYSFELQPNTNLSLWVSSDWQGRVWGRTNCSFNDQGTAQGGGQACGSGDCGGALSCKVTGNTPVTLAEWTLDGGDGQTYYDISLVDGYNIPVAIVMLPGSNSSYEDIPPNQTNPSCVASVGDLAEQTWDPYSSGTQQFLGTNSSFALPFETKVTSSECANWCPWDLQVTPPTSPGDGVYPYPDGNIARPPFDPCLSACAKYNKAEYCCTGKHNSPQSCPRNYYSKAAKGVCPDAYSYAYDDSDSTFVIPTGAGFEVVFCPGGRSTAILQSKAGAKAKQ
ncbi:Osmotin, thaumatin-like protein [Polychaeton citri CBS 116435]|uniref:Osmotin, thaumatin-like protein n=1 Tax=Polychaeton citri CBS 116435 TaxID=1314669 RepID=A0A9P4Q752_9PEZI|nr:Osmotin, thaumatin-like protein [Polychaeton citri CBS 116435]